MSPGTPAAGVRLTTTLPLALPVDVGANRIDNVHVSPGDRTRALGGWMQSLAPLAPTPYDVGKEARTWTLPLLWLATVTVRVDRSPTSTEPKASEVGSTETAPTVAGSDGVPPTPSSETTPVSRVAPPSE